jgi:hypothetical protein
MRSSMMTIPAARRYLFEMTGVFVPRYFIWGWLHSGRLAAVRRWIPRVGAKP